MTFWDKLQANVGAFLAGTSVSEEQARSDAADAALARENDADAERYGPEWAAQVLENQTREESAYGQDVAAEIEAGFEEGYADGRENIADFGRGVGTVVGDVAGSAAGGVAAGAWVVFKKNWWWMLPVGIGLFFFYGGARFLPNRKAAK